MELPMYVSCLEGRPSQHGVGSRPKPNLPTGKPPPPLHGASYEVWQANQNLWNRESVPAAEPSLATAEIYKRAGCACMVSTMVPRM